MAFPFQNYEEIGSAVVEPCEELVNRLGNLDVVELMADPDEIDDLDFREAFSCQTDVCVAHDAAPCRIGSDQENWAVDSFEDVSSL